MMKKAWAGAWSVVALVLWFVAGVQAEEIEGPTFVRLQTGIEVDALGKVVAVEIDPDSKLPDLLQQRAIRVIQGWHFKPVIRDGDAVAGKTWANVQLCLVPRDEESLNVAVAFSSNGPGEVMNSRTSTMPPFPPGIFASGANSEKGLEFKSRFRYRVNPDGRAELLEAELLDAKLERRYGSRWQREFRKWLTRRQFKPEVIDGQRVATVMDMPVTMRIMKHNGSRDINELNREWQSETDACRAAAGKSENQAVAVDSEFQLLPQG